MSVLLVSSLYASDVKASFLRSLSPVSTQVSCPAGLIDHTCGNAFWWECGRSQGCPGTFPWTDEHCRCACVVPAECVAKTAEDCCVTSWEVQAQDSTTQDMAVPVSVSTSFLAPTAQVSSTRTPQQSTLGPRQATEPASLHDSQPQPAAAEAAPAPSGDSSALMIVLCSILALGLACFALLVLLGCIRLFSLKSPAAKASKVKLPVANALQASSAQPTFHKTNGAVLSGHPTLLVNVPTHKKHVQPKHAWAQAENKSFSSSGGMPTHHEVNEAVEAGRPTLLVNAPTRKKHVQRKRASGQAEKHSVCSLGATPTASEFTSSALPCSGDKNCDILEANLTKHHSKALKEAPMTAFAPVVMPTADRQGAGTSGLGEHDLEEDSSPQFTCEATVCEAAVRSALGLTVIRQECIAVRSAFGLPAIQEEC